MGKFTQYHRKYCSQWEDDPILSDWVQRVEGENGKAFCKYCRTTIRAHYGDLLSHAKTRKHQRNESTHNSKQPTIISLCVPVLPVVNGRESINEESAPTLAVEAALKKSEEFPFQRVEVRGYDFNKGLDYRSLLQSFHTSGFQATHFGKALEEITKMIDCRRIPLSKEDEDNFEEDPFIQRRNNCTIFLGYTSNMVSSGIRETIRFLVEHKMVDCIVTTAGGIEEDFIKCFAHTYLGDFKLDGAALRDRGINRTGNLLVPNDNYCQFENWIMPILDAMLEEQQQTGVVWSPSKIITRLGQEIDHHESIYYWATKNEIPVFCPALTDGSLGDMIYFHSFKNPGLIVDIAQDIRRLNSIAVKAINSGMIILGGGLIKHHICNANMMRNGADFAVYINTGIEADGSDSGATPDEAVSWGKIKKTATPVKIHAEATLIFPLLVAETFARRHFISS